MDEVVFSIGSVLRSGWRKFKENPYTWVGALILMGLLLASQPFVMSLISGVPIDWNFSSDPSELPETSTNSDFLFYLITFIYAIVQYGLTLGFVYMGLRAADGQPVTIVHLFSRFQYVLSYIVAHLIFCVIIIVGMLLLFFPAAIWGAKYSLYPYFIADRGVGPIRALQLSSETTKGFKWDIFAYMVISFFLHLIGVALFLVGLLFVIPVITVGWAVIYRKLLAARSQQPARVVQTPENEQKNVSNIS